MPVLRLVQPHAASSTVLRRHVRHLRFVQRPSNALRRAVGAPSGPTIYTTQGQASAAVAEVASGNDVAWMTGEALRCQGLIEDDTEILQAAVAAHARGSRPLRLALGCENAGSALTRHGHAERGRPLLDRAAGIYEGLGAARDLARAEAALREAGIRRGRRGPRSRPQFGWQSLTPTELSIAGLVAEGLSNRQIGERLYISYRTVQTHLAHVFSELDISSRAQLAAEVTRRRDEMDQ